MKRKEKYTPFRLLGTKPHSTKKNAWNKKQRKENKVKEW